MKKFLSVIMAAALLLLGCTSEPATITTYDDSAAYDVDQQQTVAEFDFSDEMVLADFVRKVDGDTAYFRINLNPEEEAEIDVRFLAIDTPETVKQGVEVQNYGPEASEYTASRLDGAHEIYLEWDDEADIQDAYGRYLAWVWVDGSLLQEELVSQGLAEVAYLYGNYKYVDELQAAEASAKEAGLGIWSEGV